MEEIRQTARKLETVVSSKLNQYSKLTSYTTLEKKSGSSEDISTLDTEISETLVKVLS